jgi:hypothetical protein
VTTALSQPNLSSSVPSGEDGAAAMDDPVILLSPPLSVASFACACLGQHPQMYSLLETHLFLAETLREWWDICANASFNMAHGLLRAVAQLYFGEQTDPGVQLAGAWLRRRLPFTTGYVVELLAQRVHPRRLVEKSPSLVFHLGSMQRAQRMFPQARFIHLLQHPHAHGRAVVAAVKEAMAHQPRLPQWLRQLACFSATQASEDSQERFELDPQQAWHALNKNICDFLEPLPNHQKLRVRGEDILAQPEATFRSVAEWLELRTDEDAMEAMKHPERSPYACFGPPSARYGDNTLFLRAPALPPPGEPDELDAPSAWREDGQGLSPQVKALARQFGYE